MSAMAARDKNCCQSCLNDLEYAVPFHVRDHVMEALGEETAPRSDVNSQYHWANKRKRQEEDGEGDGACKPLRNRTVSSARAEHPRPSVCCLPEQVHGPSVRESRVVQAATRTRS